MANVFITGDKHGDYSELETKLTRYKATKQDVVIILGDHGTLYYEDRSAERKKKWLNDLPATFICIRGNHDHRPDCAAYSHKLIDVNEPTHAGSFYIDEKYPNILYTKEYGWYRFGTKRVFVIGGAFSVDKYKRVKMQEAGFTGYLWFSDEQLYPRERDDAQCQLVKEAQGEFYVMSHTVPMKYVPRDTFMPNVDQKTVDNTMEWWLNDLEDGLSYQKWYCGHWHIDRTQDKVEFLYECVMLFDEIEDNKNESGNSQAAT